MRRTALVLVLTAMLIAIATCSCRAQIIAAKLIDVIDGDTITAVHDGLSFRVRFAGIDAPELDQPGGLDSRANLARLAENPLTLELFGRDFFGRQVAIVRCGDEDLNLSQVRDGQAIIDRQHFRRVIPANRQLEYEQAQEEAKKEHRGFWAQINPMLPKQWRKSHKPHR